jgi:hypothetical protein
VVYCRGCFDGGRLGVKVPLWINDLVGRGDCCFRSHGPAVGGGGGVDDGVVGQVVVACDRCWPLSAW